MEAARIVFVLSFYGVAGYLTLMEALMPFNKPRLTSSVMLYCIGYGHPRYRIVFIVEYISLNENGILHFFVPFLLDPQYSVTNM